MLVGVRHVLPVLILSFLISGQISASAEPVGGAATASETASFVPGEFIVKFKPGVTATQAHELTDGGEGEVVRKLLNPRTWLYRFDTKKSRDEVLRKIKKRQDVEFAEPNGYVRAFYAPNDPLYRARRQWNFRQLNVGRAWNYSTGRGVVVAVVDTGVARYLGDFNRTRFVRGYDFANRDHNPNDDHGHGSHVAGTIAQSTDNGRGVAGIAYHSSIMPVKVLDGAGFGTFGDVADGIRWAAKNGARVINLSLGSSSHSSAMKDAVDYARYRKNVVVVAAAGNSATNRLSYPAAYASVVSVSATDFNRSLTWYSSWGTGLTLAAPGGDTRVDASGDGHPDGILQQTLGGGRGSYRYFQGTSMAAPHVAGVAALLRARHKRWGANDIINTLKYSARDRGAPGYDTEYGWGMVSAAGALRYRSMSAPTLTNPNGPTSVRAGSSMNVTWNRKGKDYLRYQLAYSPNAQASGTKEIDFEGGRFNPALRTDGDQPWALTRETAYRGAFSGRSGDIGDSQVSELFLNTQVKRGSTISFVSRVSSEAGYDLFDFYIDGRRVSRRSGSAGWLPSSFPVPAGNHVLRWVYTKDYSVSEGLDAVFIDNIRLTNASRAQWFDIVRSTPKGAASATWNVPAARGGDYRLRIHAFNDVKYGVWIYSQGRISVE